MLTMKKILLTPFLVILLIGCPACSGQEREFSYCSSPVGWDQVSMAGGGLPAGIDRILVVTNRPYDPDRGDGILFPNEIAQYREVSYLLASCDGSGWKLSLLPDMETGLSEIDEGGDMLLFVHGHGKSLPQVLTRAHQVRELYGVAVVVFDWPSRNSNFNKSLSRVRRCGENYYNLLLQLQDYRNSSMTGEQHLSMMLHSLGNYYLTHMVVNGNIQYLDEKIFDNIIMSAPAVRSKEHGEVLSRVNIQDRLYILFNDQDKVLRGAHLLTSGRMLGNVVMDPLAPNATYVDFTAVAGMEHTYFAGYHDFEFDLPAMGHFFDTAIHGGKVNFNDPDMYLRQGERPRYVVRNPDLVQE